jgi:hypothetical protein
MRRVLLFPKEIRLATEEQGDECTRKTYVGYSRCGDEANLSG